MARGTNRILVAGVGLAAAAAVLVGCSDDKGGPPAPSTAAASGTGSATQVSTSGNTEVKVEGQDLAGLDLNSVTCVKSAGKINVASAPIGGGAQGLGLVMTDEATPKMAGPAAVAAVRVATAAPVAGISVRLRSGAFNGTGVLDADGIATLRLVDSEQQPVTETQAWDHDWPTTVVTIGADTADSDTDDSDDAARARERIRAFVRARLARPGPDAYLAEILAAESDY